MLFRVISSIFSEIDYSSIAFISWIAYIFLTLSTFASACARKGPIHNEKSVPLRWLFIVCMVLLSVFAQFTGDYVGYKNIVNSVFSQIRFIAHFEDVYVWIIHAVTGNYELFRLVIALLTYIPLYYIFAKARIFDPRIIFFFCVWDLWNALEGRQQIAIYLAMLGLILLLLKEKKILGLVLIAVSFFFHKSSMMFPLILVALAFSLNRRNVLICLAFLPVAVVLENTLLKHILASNAQFAGDAYLTMEAFGRTTAMSILQNGRTLLYYMVAIFIIVKMMKAKNVHPFYRAMSKILFGAVYISTVLLFLDIEQNTLFLRSIRYWRIPMLCCLPVIMEKKFYKNSYLIICTFGIFFFALLYTLVMMRYGTVK